jgi:hypothetical protein
MQHLYPALCTGYSGKHARVFMYRYLDRSMIHERKLPWAVWVQVNMCSVWDPSTLWTHCKWTTTLSTVMQQVTCGLLGKSFNFCFQLLSSVGVGVVHTNFKVAQKEILTGISVWWTWWPEHMHPKHCDNCFKWLSNIPCRMPKMPFAVSEHAPSCWENAMSTCPAPWIIGMTSFCVYCRYCWFVTVPSINIGPTNPCLLTAHHMVHSTGWSDISIILCVDFQRPRTLCSACLWNYKGGNEHHH